MRITYNLIDKKKKSSYSFQHKQFWSWLPGRRIRFSVPFFRQADASSASPAPLAASPATPAAQVDARRVVLGGSEAVVWCVTNPSSEI
jgi:hypothetical protein